MDEKGRTELTTHIKERVSSPISKKDFLAGCGNLDHVPTDRRDRIGASLPERIYQFAEDNFHALQPASLTIGRRIHRGRGPRCQLGLTWGSGRCRLAIELTE